MRSLTSRKAAVIKSVKKMKYVIIMAPYKPPVSGSEFKMKITAKNPNRTAKVKSKNLESVSHQ